MNYLLTVPATRAQLVQDNIHVSLAALRHWVADGTLPSLSYGNRTLLHYPTVLSTLTQHYVEDNVN